MANRPVYIHWFRQDLRLADNPALHAAAKAGLVLPVYILDDVVAKEHRMGATSRLWLHHSLHALNRALDGKLCVYAGDPAEILQRLCQTYAVQGVYWNRCYEPWRVAYDTKLKQQLREQGIQAQSLNGSLLWEPWDIAKPDGTSYQVFTPFYCKGCLQAAPPRVPLPAPPDLTCVEEEASADAIDALALRPSLPWGDALIAHWQVGEEGARNRLYDFIEHGLFHYKEGRDVPGKAYVSRLSPHLHFGEISPHQAWHAVQMRGEDANVEHFCRELGWREFSYHLLYHHPHLPKEPLQERFQHFAWHEDSKVLACWQKGETGYPIVDAGMRELWQTGYMHNRVRMIVGSFLVKNLLLHWHHGERWFWDCLVDADVANNSASWQWIAGCGADAAPYFRVFNPVLQAKKFDPEGTYTRRYVPELAQVPDRYLFAPWEAPEDVLTQAGVVLGQDYPHPIVELKASRDRALEAFSFLKQIAESENKKHSAVNGA